MSDEAARLIRLAANIPLCDDYCQCEVPDYTHDRARKCEVCGGFVPFEDDADCLDWIEAMKTPEARGAK